jgi:hypothetical protein
VAIDADQRHERIEELAYSCRQQSEKLTEVYVRAGDHQCGGLLEEQTIARFHDTWVIRRWNSTQAYGGAFSERIGLWS